MTTALTTTNGEMSLSELGNVLTKSRYFTDATDASQAIVKVLAGRELGIGPIASMTGIHIIKGKPALGANLLASCLKRSGRYDYRVKELTPQNAVIEFFETIGGKRESLGISAFSIADARAAGTQNLDKFARNMLFARALSNGVRWYCPDVTGGPVYTPEELGAPVNGDGDVIESSAKLVAAEPPKPQADNESVTAKSPKSQASSDQPQKPFLPTLTFSRAIEELNAMRESGKYNHRRLKELFEFACKQTQSRGMSCEERPTTALEAANSVAIMIGRCEDFDAMQSAAADNDEQA